MAHPLITHFEPDTDRLAVIRECMENYDVGDPDAEWPNNIISRRAVVYGSGAVTRQCVAVHHAIDPNELALCRRLAADAAALMDGVEVNMGSESGDPFRAFFIAANVDEPAPAAIDEHLIRLKFGGTLFPPVTIVVEPLVEAGKWWSEVELDASDLGEDHFRRWRALNDWFRSNSEFVDSAFVRIGDRQALWDVELRKDELPEGTAVTGCVLPRLALGLTKQGSVAGLFGFTVQS